jgi:hypothetical protein
MFRWATLPLVLATLAFGPARADAITLQEIIELSRAGLGEEVLLALIEVDQRVFQVDPETLRTLKKAGVSEKVIVAIIKSGRPPQPALQAAAPLEVVEPETPAPQVVVIEREPIVREVPVAVAVPVYVPVVRSRSRHVDDDDRDRTPRRPAEPVYWGWGGKLRPDAWKPSPTDVPRKPDGRKR